MLDKEKEIAQWDTWLVEAVKKIRIQKQRPGIDRIYHAVRLLAEKEQQAIQNQRSPIAPIYNVPFEPVGIDQVQKHLDRALKKGILLKILSKGQASFKCSAEKCDRNLNLVQQPSDIEVSKIVVKVLKELSEVDPSSSQPSTSISPTKSQSGGGNSDGLKLNEIEEYIRYSHVIVYPSGIVQNSPEAIECVRPIVEKALEREISKGHVELKNGIYKLIATGSNSKVSSSSSSSKVKTPSASTTAANPSEVKKSKKARSRSTSAVCKLSDDEPGESQSKSKSGKKAKAAAGAAVESSSTTGSFELPIKQSLKEKKVAPFIIKTPQIASTFSASSSSLTTSVAKTKSKKESLSSSAAAAASSSNNNNNASTATNISPTKEKVKIKKSLFPTTVSSPSSSASTSLSCSIIDKSVNVLIKRVQEEKRKALGIDGNNDDNGQQKDKTQSTTTKTTLDNSGINKSFKEKSLDSISPSKTSEISISKAGMVTPVPVPAIAIRSSPTKATTSTLQATKSSPSSSSSSSPSKLVKGTKTVVSHNKDEHDSNISSTNNVSNIRNINNQQQQQGSTSSSSSIIVKTTKKSQVVVEVEDDDDHDHDEESLSHSNAVVETGQRLYQYDSTKSNKKVR